MTRITFKGSSRVLGASIIGASLLLAGGSSAFAAPTPESPTSQTSTAESTAQPADSDKQNFEITLGIDKEVEASPRLVVPVTLSAKAGTGLKIVHASNNETVKGTETELATGGDELDAELDGSALEPGTYIVKTDDNLKSSDDFTVSDPDETDSKDSDPTPDQSPEPTESTAASDGAEGKSETPDEKSPSEDDEDTADAELDEFYPELAKELFGQDDGTYKISDPKGGGTGAGNIPSGLQKYYNQSVDLSGENCQKLGYPDYTSRIGRTPECGYVIAPIDAKNPKAGNVAIAMMKVPSGKVVDGKFEKTKSQGTVAWNPGGPGGSGMTMGVAGAISEPDLAASFDLVGFDPRGTGGSMPFSQCSTDEQLDADRAEDAWAGDRDEAEDLLNEQYERYANDCIENTGKLFDLGEDGQENLMKHLGTWDAVGDLDLIRSTSQDEKLDYIGFSYGTRLGYVYAQKFPQNVGRLVLDGAVDPGNAEAYKALKDINKDPQTYLDASGKVVKAQDAEEDEDDSVKQIAGFQGTFEQFALDCSTKGAEGRTWAETYPGIEFPKHLESLADETFTCALGDGIDDRDALTKANQNILRFLEGNPVPTGIDGDDRNVTFGDARTGVIQALYSESLWPDLALGLAELKAGDSAGVLMQLADSYNERDAEGHYDPMLQAFTNIRCTDENSFGKKPDIKELRDLAKRYDEAGPFQSASVSPGVYDYCDFWKFKGTLPKPKHLTAVPNVLVVSTSHDSATPYAAGVKLARTIDGSLLSVSGASHTSYMSGDENKACTDATVNGFLTKGTLPKLGDFGPKLPKPDTAVDDRDETITLPNRCKMDTFRADDFTLSNDTVHAGDKVQATVKHLGSEQPYTVEFETGGTFGSLSTDNGGNATAEVTVPKAAKPGTYVVQVLDADDKTAANTTLTVVDDDEGKSDDGSKDGKDVDPKGGGSDDGGSDGATAGSNGGSSDGSADGQDNNGSGNGGGHLPRTGAELLPLIAAALALLTVGGLVYRASRRKTAAH